MSITINYINDISFMLILPNAKAVIIIFSYILLSII